MVQWTALQRLLLILADLFQTNQCVQNSPLDYPQCHLWNLQNYDFIIVGSGPAGCVLANRLSENPNWNVLLVEAGDYPSDRSQIPDLFTALVGTKEDWAFESERGSTYSLGYENKRSRMPQGKVLGGGSGINGNIFTKGEPEDYDAWAKMGNTNWNSKTMGKYFKKLDARLSNSGYVKTNLYESEIIGRQLLINAAEEIGYPVNEGVPIEFRDSRTTIQNGQRHSMAKAYLSPIKNRRNLCVLVNSVVTKILIEGQKAVGVRMLTEVGNVNVMANKEVIVSAGALNSPKLLLLSGIGPVDHLSNIGIETVKDLPVGRFHKDHAGIPIYIQLPPGIRYNFETIPEVKRYCSTKTGELATIQMANFQGYISTQNLSYPDVEFMLNMFSTNNPIGIESFFGFNQKSTKSLLEILKKHSLVFALVTLLHPASSGYMELADKDPLKPPKIYPFYLSDPKDHQTVWESIKFWTKLLQTESLQGSDFANFEIPNCKQHDFKARDYWLCYMENFATSFYHHTGTCRMGPRDDYTSVVNPELQVWGIDNLRVCDTSVFPGLVSGHTMIPAVAVAEHAADIIKKHHNYF